MWQISSSSLLFLALPPPHFLLSWQTKKKKSIIAKLAAGTFIALSPYWEGDGAEIIGVGGEGSIFWGVVPIVFFFFWVGRKWWNCNIAWLARLDVANLIQGVL